MTVSALALALASKNTTLLAECDPAGGTIRTGYLQGSLSAGFGLSHLAAADRIGPAHLANAFASHLWAMDEAGYRKVLPGLTDPTQAASLAGTWGNLAELLDGMTEEGGHEVYVDAGRLVFDAGRLHPTLTPAPLLHRADLVLMVVRSDDRSLSLAHHLIKPLRAELQEHGNGSDALGLLVIEGGPYRTHQVAAALQTPVVAGLPWDAETAAYLSGGGTPPRGYAHSPLLRSARTASEEISAAASTRHTQQKYSPQPNGVLQRLTHPSRGGQSHG
ncbi:hypothetical protein [Streptomyces sp. NBC_01465]|uniref:hypothetical protein n=1 Tax=Streptomyces sp. NBC_01465 TaxID=2903878 RepID=UPI002E31F3AE|nr:hypothetical protein [Streptomyces sp. NBC_01465]